jgi:hypothetical protein
MSALSERLEEVDTLLQQAAGVLHVITVVRGGVEHTLDTGLDFCRRADGRLAEGNQNSIRARRRPERSGASNPSWEHWDAHIYRLSEREDQPA